MFITFEGGEGSGKTTQIQLLTKALQSQGFLVEVTREPGGTAIGDDIRKILLDAKNAHMTPLCEMLLYWAARAQHLEEKIKPWLASGKVVLCDRFVDSTVVYQGYARDLDRPTIRQLETLVCQDLKPDVTFVLDIPVDRGLERANARMAGDSQKEDRFEQEKRDFHDRVHAGFLDLAEKEPNRFAVIDADRDIESIHNDILTWTLDGLKNNEQ